METLEHIMYYIAAITIFFACLIKIFNFGYRRGYSIGKHCGFTEGLYAAAKRKSSKHQCN